MKIKSNILLLSYFLFNNIISINIIRTEIFIKTCIASTNENENSSLKLNLNRFNMNQEKEKRNLESVNSVEIKNINENSFRSIEFSKCKSDNDCLMNNYCFFDNKDTSNHVSEFSINNPNFEVSNIGVCTLKNMYQMNFLLIFQILILLIIPIFCYVNNNQGSSLIMSFILCLNCLDFDKSIPIAMAIHISNFLGVILIENKTEIKFPDIQNINYDFVMIFSPLMINGSFFAILIINYVPFLLKFSMVFCFLLLRLLKILKKNEIPVSIINSNSMKKKNEESLVIVVNKMKMMEKYVNIHNVILENSDEESNNSVKSNLNKKINQNINEINERNINFKLSELKSHPFNSDVINAFENELEIKLEKITDKFDGSFDKKSLNIKNQFIELLTERIELLSVVNNQYLEKNRKINFSKLKTIFELMYFQFMYLLFYGTNKVKSIIGIDNNFSMRFIFNICLIFISIKLTFLIMNSIVMEEKLVNLINKILKTSNKESYKISISNINYSSLLKIFILAIISGFIHSLTGLAIFTKIGIHYLDYEMNSMTSISTVNFLTFINAVFNILFNYLQGNLLVEFSFILSLTSIIGLLLGYQIISSYYVKYKNLEPIISFNFYLICFFTIIMILNIVYRIVILYGNE